MPQSKAYLPACWLFFSTVLLVLQSRAQDSAPASNKEAKRSPSIADHPYGAHERQVLDVYFGTGEGKRPVVINIHGGGWVRGDKTQLPYLAQLQDAGITVVSMNYRYSWQAQKAGVEPPVAWPIEDAIRVVQVVRSKSNDWRIDPERVAATGGSAGACSSLLLATWPDQRNPTSDDPVSRQSTRIQCAAVNIAQTSLDPQQMKAWIPNSVYGGHAFGFMDPDNLASRDTQFDRFLSQRARILPWIEKYSPWFQVSADDPPIFLQYQRPPTSDPQAKDPTHSTNFGVHFLDRCKKIGVPCELAFPGSPDSNHKDIADFLIKMLHGKDRVR
jgi:acetyl esterase/lipase